MQQLSQSSLLIVPFSVGGSTNILARIVGQKLNEKVGQPVVVESRMGADGTIAADFVAHSAPDGYTTIMISNDFTIPTSGYKLNYDSATSSAPVIEIASVLVSLFINQNSRHVTSR